MSRHLRAPLQCSCISTCVSAQLHEKTHPEFFPRHVFVLQAKSAEVRDTDEWAGKVKAVVKRVDALQDQIGNKIKDVDTKVDEMAKKMDEKLGEMDERLGKILDLLSSTDP